MQINGLVINIKSRNKNNTLLEITSRFRCGCEDGKNGAFTLRKQLNSTKCLGRFQLQ